MIRPDEHVRDWMLAQLNGCGLWSIDPASWRPGPILRLRYTKNLIESVRNGDTQNSRASDSEEDVRLFNLTPLFPRMRSSRIRR
jgi:hypothetical protein